MGFLTQIGDDSGDAEVPANVAAHSVGLAAYSAAGLAKPFPVELLLTSVHAQIYPAASAAWEAFVPAP